MDSITFRCGVVVALFAALLAALFNFEPAFPIPPPGVILITGAGSGIGREVALHLSKKLPNHEIWAMVRQQTQIDELKVASEGKIQGVWGDLTKPESLSAAVNKLVGEAGKPLVGFFDCAGLPVQTRPVEFLDVNALREIYEVDVFGLLTLLQHVLPHLRQSKGRVVFMGSISGAVTPGFFGGDTARAVETIADAMRREVAPAGVAVSVVQAGFVDSPVLSKTDKADAAFRSTEKGKEMKNIYPKLSSVDFGEHATTDMAPMKVVGEAVYDALTSARPRIRYIVGAVPAGLPSARILVALCHFLPHHILDLLD